jgi:23S rRNA (uracil-5-)-methyltransferase RumA
MRPFHRNEITELTISDLAFGGKGIAKVDTPTGDYVVFVPNSIPGQKLKVRVIKPKKSYAEAKLLQVLEPSPLEQKTPYNPIPGAPYITLSLAEQHRYKKEGTIELFKRIAKVAHADELFDTFIASPRSFHYRNKMEYSFSAVGYNAKSDAFEDEFVLGFKKRGQWLAVEPLQGDSGMFDKQLEEFIPQIQDYFKSRGFSAWHSKKNSGFCRMLAVKKSYAQNSLLLNLVTTSSQLDTFDSQHFTDFVKTELRTRLAGLVHTVNNDISDRPKATDGQQKLLFGQDFMEEDINGLSFKISLESFFQTNPASAEKLYQKALDYVFESSPDQKPVILDLFSGTGTITQLLAQGAPQAEIIGVELVPEAVNDAKKNAAANGFDNLQFFAADVGKFLLEQPQYAGKIHTLTLDPPRAGIAPKTLRKIIRLEANRMVYISCNPATQARDMQTLAQAGYILKKFSLVDQFPHTAHIECVALFEKENGAVA